jgi:hypothetical protein
MPMQLNGDRGVNWLVYDSEVEVNRVASAPDDLGTVGCFLHVSAMCPLPLQYMQRLRAC